MPRRRAQGSPRTRRPASPARRCRAREPLTAGPLAPSCRAVPRLVSCSRRPGLVGLSRFCCALVHAAPPGHADTAAQGQRPLCLAAGPVWGDPVWSQRHAGPGGASGGRVLVLPASRHPCSGSSSGSGPPPHRGGGPPGFLLRPAPPSHSVARLRPLHSKLGPWCLRSAILQPAGVPRHRSPWRPVWTVSPPPVCWFLAGGPVV